MISSLKKRKIKLNNLNNSISLKSGRKKRPKKNKLLEKMTLKSQQRNFKTRSLTQLDTPISKVFTKKMLTLYLSATLTQENPP